MRALIRSLVVVTALVAACGGPAPEEFGQSTEALSKRLDTGRIIVQFKSGISETTKSSLHRTNGGTLHKKLKNGAHVVKVTPASTKAILAKYKANSAVAWAEVDALVDHTDATTKTPNDPYLSYQWQHDAIQAPAAWAVGTGSSTVLIAICDTGISSTHPDLKNSLRMDLCWNTAYGAAGDCDPVAWHGTATAGSAAALGNNGVGVAGSAWAAQIIPVRVSNQFDGSAYISDMADCITYGADKGAKVINLSYQTYDSGTIYQSILDAANYAESKGAVTFVSAGNEGANGVTSQDPTQIVFVAATDNTNAAASFSNYGNYVDIAAPGVDIVTTGVDVTCSDANGNGVVDRGECTSSNDSYIYASGTSFSSPIAAGAAVVLKALNPNATPADIRSAMYSTATDLGTAGEDTKFGKGLLNFHEAAHKIVGATTTTNTAPLVTILSPTAGAVGTVGMPIIVQGTATDTQDGDLSASIRWDFGDGTTATGATWGNHAYAAAGTYLITASATDKGGLTGKATFSLSVVAAVNAKPTVSITSPSSSTLTVNAGASYTFVANATDAEQGDLSASIVWTVGSGSATGSSVSVTFPSAGSYTVTASVTDNAGQKASASVTVTAQATTATLQAVANLTATASTTSRAAKLAWNDPNTSAVETSLGIERAKVYSSGSLGTWARVATLSFGATSYTDSPSKAGTYTYRVRSINGTQSALSARVNVTVR